MTDNIEFSITGLDSLLGKLDALKVETRQKGGRAALRRSSASSMRSRSPPGSTTAALPVRVHTSSEQFCENGVTGTRAS